LENYFEYKSGQKPDLSDPKSLTMNPPFFDQFVKWMTDEYFPSLSAGSVQEKVKILLKDILEYFNQIHIVKK